MIALPEQDRLAPEERYGLAVLVDQSRLVPLASSGADAGSVQDVVRVAIAERGEPEATAVQRLLAAERGIVAGDGVVTVTRELLRAVTDVAGAAIEQRSAAADRYERVPSSENPLVAEGTERRPLVSEAAKRLRDAAIASAGSRRVVLAAPWPRGRRWAVAMTHDVDAVDWWPLFTALRLTELSRKGEWRRMTRSLRSAASTWDPVRAGVSRILDVEHRNHVRATWFFLCGTPSLRTMARGDLTYRPESKRARWVADAVSGAGHEPGLHGSFATMRSAATFQQQRTRLERLSGRTVRGVRQHYLRMRPGETQRAMRDAGFHFDATYGFPDRSGFRLGVADVVRGWDADEREATSLASVPLAWMDRAMSKYSGVELPERWVDDGLDIAAVCRAHEGLWCGLWHPNLTAALGYPDAEREFDRLVESLAHEAPYSGTLSAIVEWRSARERMRVLGVAADGTVRLGADDGRPWQPATQWSTGHALVEDGGGQVMRADFA